MTHFGSISRVGRVYTPSVRPIPTRTIYVRPGGDDNAAGTETAPLATLMEAMHRVPSIIDDAFYVIDLTGYSDVAGGRFNLPPKFSALPTDLVFTGGSFVHDTNRAPLSFRATPTVEQTITVSSTTADVVTGLRTLTTTANLTLNQLRGRLVQAALGDWGVVVSNTAGPNSTIYITALTWPTGATLAVLTLTCELAFGDLADFFNVSAGMNSQCDVSFTGIKLANTNDPAGNVAINQRGGQRAYFQLCELEGLYSEHAGLIRFDACYFHDGLLGAYGTQFTIYQSYLRNVDIQYHGEGGIAGQGYYSCVAEGCTPLGHHNNYQSDGGVDIDQCDIISPKVNGSSVGAATVGVLLRGGASSRVRKTKINGATEGVRCESPSRVLLDNVQGTNTDVGVGLYNGAQMERANVSAITGANGDIRLGNVIVTWAAGATGNADHYVRWF